MKEAVVRIVCFIVFSSLAAAGVTQTSDSSSTTVDQMLKAGEIQHWQFDDWAGPGIRVWSYLPDREDLRDRPILMMMHGAKRASERYLREWQSVADTYGIIVIAPEFSGERFPGAVGYNLGYVFEQEGSQKRPETLWSFSAIEPLFDSVVKKLKGKQSHYTLYGHSAGAQFVHRYLYYKPGARVKRFIAANAGWYTLPSLTIDYPYGLRKAEVDQANVIQAFEADVLILLGDKDVDANHRSLRRTPEALAQGAHRFARGWYFFEHAKQLARQFGTPFNWQVVSVPNVAHSNSGMATAAGGYVE